MGMVFGKTGISVENGLSPPFQVMASRSGYDIRWYPSYIIAEVAPRPIGVTASGKKENSSSNFELLANYIGVFGNPANKKEGGDVGESISMTAPVVMTPEEKPKGEGEAISMTAPVVMNKGEKGDGERQVKGIQFIMPQKYKKLSELPKPTDSRVLLKEVPPRGVLVKEYSGSYDAKLEEEKTKELLASVKEDGVFDLPEGGEGLNSQVAHYNPPFCLPFMRRNEVWIDLKMTKEKIAALLKDKGVQVAADAGAVEGS